MQSHNLSAEEAKEEARKAMQEEETRRTYQSLVDSFFKKKLDAQLHALKKQQFVKGEADAGLQMQFK